MRIENHSSMTYRYASPTTQGVLAPGQSVLLTDMELPDASVPDSNYLTITPEVASDHIYSVLAVSSIASSPVEYPIGKKVVVEAINTTVAVVDRPRLLQATNLSTKLPPTPGTARSSFGGVGSDLPEQNADVGKTILELYDNATIKYYFYTEDNPSPTANSAGWFAPPIM